MPRWGMSLYLTAVLGVRRFMLRHAAVLGCVLALGAGVQGVLAADGLRRSGQDLIAEDMHAVLAGFAIFADFSEEPGPTSWMVAGADGRVERRADGRVVTSFDTPEELLAYFRTQAKERTHRGIFITGEFTHLKNPAAFEPLMSDHVKKLLASPRWVAQHKKSIDQLVQACERAKTDLWVNVTLGGKDVRFRKLTR